MLVRLALSKLALNSSGKSSWSAISARRWAMAKVVSADSITQGPQTAKKPSRPKSRPPRLTVGTGFSIFSPDIS